MHFGAYVIDILPRSRPSYLYQDLHLNRMGIKYQLDHISVDRTVLQRYIIFKMNV